jgi:hypothetical protein
MSVLYWRMPTCACCKASLIGMGDASFCSIECELIFEQSMEKEVEDQPPEKPSMFCGWILSYVIDLSELNMEVTNTPGLTPRRLDGTGKDMIWYGVYDEPHPDFDSQWYG